MVDDSSGGKVPLGKKTATAGGGIAGREMVDHSVLPANDSLLVNCDAIATETIKMSVVNEGGVGCVASTMCTSLKGAYASIEVKAIETIEDVTSHEKDGEAYITVDVDMSASVTGHCFNIKSVDDSVAVGAAIYASGDV